MEVLLLVSPNARMSELKKVPKLVSDLIKSEIKITYLNFGINEVLEKYLRNTNYTNFYIFESNQSKTIEEKFIVLRNYYFEKIIVLGLINNDKITKFLDYYIGSNTNLYIISASYGIHSDSSYLINEGAYLLGNIDELTKDMY